MPLFCPVPLLTPLDPKRVTGPLATDGRTTSPRPRVTGSSFFATPTTAADDRGGRRGSSSPTTSPPRQRSARRQRPALTIYRPISPAGPPARPFRELARLYGPDSIAARAGRQRFFRAADVRHSRLQHAAAALPEPAPPAAVEYAVDRPAMAHAYFDAPAERVAQLPGYGRGHTYPLTGPDLADGSRAGRFQATQGRALDALRLRPGAAGILRANLARIGIIVRIVRFGGCDQQAVLAAFRQADMVIGTNLFCGPANAIRRLFSRLARARAEGSAASTRPWYAPAFQRQLAAAARLRGRASRRLPAAGRSAGARGARCRLRLVPLQRVLRCPCWLQALPAVPTGCRSRLACER
jgi:hypothetical protein